MRLSQAVQIYRAATGGWHRQRERAHNAMSPPRSGDVSTWEPWNGSLRTFEMLATDETATDLPPEEKEVSRRYTDYLGPVKSALSEYVDATITRDVGNRQATASIRHPETDEIIAADVPVFTLIALEKDFENLLTLVKEIPEPPQGDTWEPNGSLEVLESRAVTTLRTAAVRKQTVVVPETQRNPAQFDTWQENVPVAKITSVKRHGGIRTADKREAVHAAQLALTAIKNALEEGNAAQEVERVRGVGAALLDIALPGITAVR